METTMETTFSKGNWKTDIDSSTHYAIVYNDATQRRVATCMEQGQRHFTSSFDEAVANAKLIAAAPELLKALAECQTLIDNVILQTPTGALRERITDMNIKAMAAIKKATL